MTGVNVDSHQSVTKTFGNVLAFIYFLGVADPKPRSTVFNQVNDPLRRAFGGVVVNGVVDQFRDL